MTSRLPLLAERHDLVVAAPDEVPPHHDLLAERLAADEQRAQRFVSRLDDELVGSGGHDTEMRGRDRDALQGRSPGIHHQAVFEGRVGRDADRSRPREGPAVRRAAS